jgi:hypothetical protein
VSLLLIGLFLCPLPFVDDFRFEHPVASVTLAPLGPAPPDPR